MVSSEFCGDLEACGAGTDVRYLPAPPKPCDRGRLLTAGPQFHPGPGDGTREGPLPPADSWGRGGGWGECWSMRTCEGSAHPRGSGAEVAPPGLQQEDLPPSSSPSSPWALALGWVPRATWLVRKHSSRGMGTTCNWVTL